jgi:hypothetical protein
MRLTIILICILAINSQAQSVFRFIGKGRKLRVERHIETRIRYRDLARRVLHSNNLTVVRQEPIRHPLRVVGPNLYLKGVSKRFRGFGEWNKVGDSKSYNGAHHIITKFVIKELGGNSECIRQAPSVFHPLHNDLRYIDWFHNHQKQLELYKQGGIKAIMEDFFDKAGKDLTDAERQQLILEAELWSKHWDLRWE